MKEKSMGSRKQWSSQEQACKWPKLQQEDTSHQSEKNTEKKDSSEYLIFKTNKEKEEKAAAAYGKEIQCREKNSIKRKIKHLVNRMAPQEMSPSSLEPVNMLTCTGICKASQDLEINYLGEPSVITRILISETQEKAYDDGSRKRKTEDPTVNFEDGESGQELRYTGGIWKVGMRGNRISPAVSGRRCNSARDF